jgi:transcription initiation factor IIE alpha subunit
MIRYSEIETKIIQGAKEDGAKEIAKNLLRNGFDIDSVAMNTNLPKKTIKKLLESVMEEKNEG